ncbi:AcrR family transcriptional regulator [Paraburkholderia bannensis]|uniref:AcrR family transcriptional regulator n=1 Tax=Paraburkholderia bannensis TaxID=765414 RepID=A0A7W9TZN3_9BURK|nr:MULTISPECIES: TetR/AcrR family transcriptional regulator [Paraburkholderia]MBB3259287.1 AcrR family transcriptional regulator [Paraburkholderia sp. WP4_3_2]MBB6104303.1 AcrR family transcriptional regulator [Paraburkholderia bannensis]
MRYTAEHKIETRKRIVDAASRLFRRDGYGGSGIDGLTKEAGVTNGAFYGHFKSKSEAFRTVVLAGMEQLRFAVADLRASHGKRWLKTFIGFYLGPKRTCDIGESCALPSFSPEMVRADAETREAYEAELLRLIEAVAAGLGDEAAAQRDDKAIALLAMLSGGVTLARAVPDPALSKRIADAIERSALALTCAPRKHG